MWYEVVAATSCRYTQFETRSTVHLLAQDLRLRHYNLWGERRSELMPNPCRLSIAPSTADGQTASFALWAASRPHERSSRPESGYPGP